MTCAWALIMLFFCSFSSSFFKSRVYLKRLDALRTNAACCKFNQIEKCMNETSTHWNGNANGEELINNRKMHAYSPTLEGLRRSIFCLCNIKRIVRINEEVVIVVGSGAVRVSAAGNGDGEETIGGWGWTMRCGTCSLHVLHAIVHLPLLLIRMQIS